MWLFKYVCVPSIHVKHKKKCITAEIRELLFLWLSHFKTEKNGYFRNVIG